MYYANDIVEELKNAGRLVIFGAGLVAFEVANCLMGKPYRLSVSYFMVSRKRENPDEVMGIPVLDLDSAEGLVEKEARIVIAVMGKYQEEIEGTLYSRGYLHIIPMTFEGDLWSMIQANYYREYRLSCHKQYLDINEGLKTVNSFGYADTSKIKIYTAKCHVDRGVKEDLSRYFWEIPIQVGTALTEKRLEDVRIRDDERINISYKNEQYCELTALYWVWKNEKSAVYAGVCHYRRHFELDEELLMKLSCSDIDVVLTFPILNFPSVREVYRHDHVEKDWDIMLAGIHSLSPEYMPYAVEVQNGNYYYGYNMFIARKSILDDYCAWLFPILEYCEQRCGWKEDKYQNRYIGFLAERLLTIYMCKHEDKLKIVHIKKHFIKE